MDVVIKGTKSVLEYKEMENMLDRWAKRAYVQHKETVDNWEHGDIARVSFNGCLCVTYADGSVFPYDQFGNVLMKGGELCGY